VLSFHATKLFHTIEGGALIINNDEVYSKVKKMINFGITGLETIECLGINAKMNEFQAAMGLCVLDDVDMIIARRKEIFKYYKKNLPKCLQYQSNNLFCTANYSYFPVIFRSEESLLNVIRRLNENDIYPRRYFYPSLDALNYIKSKNTSVISCDISKRILCLPLYESLQKNEQDIIIGIIKDALVI
jgi:dTDP-4-amino-4,6-dideoxygalactose transaminase